MPPAEIDPFALPGIIQRRADARCIEDESSDDEKANIFMAHGRKAALHQRGAGAAPSDSASRGRGGARGGGRGRGKAPKAADHVLAAPLAVPGGPAPKRGSPLLAERQLREAPEKSKRRRSLSGDVSAAPAAASSAALPSGAAARPPPPRPPPPRPQSPRRRAGSLEPKACPEYGGPQNPPTLESPKQGGPPH